MTIQPYLYFAGRAEEAIALYQKVLGAELQMRWSGEDAARKNLLFAALRHGGGPVRRAVDRDPASVTRPRAIVFLPHEITCHRSKGDALCSRPL